MIQVFLPVAVMHKFQKIKSKMKAVGCSQGQTWAFCAIGDINLAIILKSDQISILSEIFNM